MKAKYISLVLVLIACGGIYFFVSQDAQTETPKQKNSVVTNNQQSDLSQYENTKFGFSFAYPVDWKVDNSNPTLPGPEGVIVSDSSRNQIMTISYNNSLEETSMATPMDKRNTLKEALGYELSEVQEVSIGGGVGYEGTFTNDVIDFKQKQIWFEHQGHIYTVGLTIGHNPEIDKILTSFKWLK